MYIEGVENLKVGWSRQGEYEYIPSVEEIKVERGLLICTFTHNKMMVERRGFGQQCCEFHGCRRRWTVSFFILFLDREVYLNRTIVESLKISLDIHD